MSYPPGPPNPPQPEGRPPNYPPPPQGYPQQPQNYPPSGYPPSQYPQQGYQPQYQQYPPNAGQYQQQWQQPATAKPARKPNPIYAIPAIGGLLLMICAFLPWLTVSFLGENLTITGLGSVSGTTDPALASGGARDGVLALILGVIALVLALLGLFLNRKGFAIALIVFGVLASGLMIFELADVNRNVSEFSSLGGGISTGIGIYLGLVGALAVLIGAILPLVIRRR
jgi:hypothetical protein